MYVIADSQYMDEFQSTPPVWVVTLVFLSSFRSYFCISIHTTRVGGDDVVTAFLFLLFISIHTTRVGGDNYDINAI